MTQFYFTFGSNHLDKRGHSLGGCYTVITVTDQDLNDGNGHEPLHAAREKMFAARDNKWAMQYESAEACGVARHGLTERTLESVSFDRHQMKLELVRARLKGERDELRKALDLCDKAEAIMAQLPDIAIEGCCVCNGQLIIYHQDREQALAVMGALSAGRWEKKLNPSHSTRIDYSATVNGVDVEIYGTEPPPSCRIVEVDEEIPAHIITTRKLVCV